MNHTERENDGNVGKPKSGEKILDFNNVLGNNVCGREGIVLGGDDPNLDYTYEKEPLKNEDSCVLQNQGNSLKENPDTLRAGSNSIYAAWWDYVRNNKVKKKKRKLLEIYRDENYWADGNCSEDEFDYAES